MSAQVIYNTNLAMGLGLIDETNVLLELWAPPMEARELFNKVLELGILPNISAYRLKNIVVRCFAPRFLYPEGPPAKYLKRLKIDLASSELTQLFFLYTCRANPILTDFIKNVYWEKYVAGSELITRDDALQFIRRAIDDGKTPSRWAEGQIKRVGRYLIGCCADFGLLSNRTSIGRRIAPFSIEPRVAAFLAHDLHFSGLGDNAVTSHSDWQLFGMTKSDVRDEFKRLSLRGHFIHQSAGDITHIGWKHKRMEEFVDVLAEG
ncbi:MAG: BrxA family protein [Candidatus Thiodiazotropha endolucinida]